MENKIEVELLNAKLLDFKTSDGDVIQGIKIFYTDKNIVKDNSIFGDIESAFIGADKFLDFIKFFEDLKEYCREQKKVGLVPSVVLHYQINSINSKPAIVGIDI